MIDCACMNQVLRYVDKVANGFIVDAKIEMGSMTLLHLYHCATGKKTRGHEYTHKETHEC